MFVESGSHSPAHLTNVHFVTNIAYNAINQTVSDAGKRVPKMEGLLIASCKAWSVGNEMAGV